MTKKEAKKLLKDYKDFLNKEIPIYTKISDYSLNKYIKEQLFIPDVVKSLKGKHTQTFDEFMAGICKNRSITLINNYTKETVSFDTLIEKWKATNT